MVTREDAVGSGGASEGGEGEEEDGGEGGECGQHSDGTGSGRAPPALGTE
jgi:hypothetical protein